MQKRVRCLSAISTTSVGPVTVISSSPSLPCTAQTRRVPRSARTRASGSAHSAAETPRSWRSTPAGFESGPSRLKIVRTGNSARTGATWRMAP